MPLGFWTKLMVVGGNPDSGKAEIYDLSEENRLCPLVSDFPIDSGSVGTFIGQKTLVCGGKSNQDSDAFYSQCFTYNKQVGFHHNNPTL